MYSFDGVLGVRDAGDIFCDADPGRSVGMVGSRRAVIAEELSNARMSSVPITILHFLFADRVRYDRCFM